MKILMENTTPNKHTLVVLFLSLCFLTQAQVQLDYVGFLKQVKKSHPLAKKALLLKDQASLVLKQARGVYDPVLSAKIKEKDFQNKNYYHMFESDLTINTIAGIQLSTGFGNDQGLYLNPESSTPPGGIGYLGASIPLGKGLFFDENRLMLRGSQQIQNQLNAESDAQLNDLYLMASEAYWNWYANHQILENSLLSVQLSQQRFDLIKQEQQVGELSPYDTLKAFLQLRDRQIEYIEAQRYGIASLFELNKYIWDKELIQNIEFVPDKISLVQMELLSANWSAANNPKLIQYTAKIVEQSYERKYKIEKLKPKLNFDYAMLYNQFLPDFGGLGKNQQWGLSFNYPLFLRSERAGLKLANIKIKSLELDFENTTKELDMKLQNEIGQLSLLKKQYQYLDQMVGDYKTLLSFENAKFSMGESSLFELNAWEVKLLEGQNKLVKIETKSAMAYAKLLWYSNSWASIIN